MNCKSEVIPLKNLFPLAVDESSSAELGAQAPSVYRLPSFRMLIDSPARLTNVISFVSLTAQQQLLAACYSCDVQRRAVERMSSPGFDPAGIINGCLPRGHHPLRVKHRLLLLPVISQRGFSTALRDRSSGYKRISRGSGGRAFFHNPISCCKFRAPFIRGRNVVEQRKDSSFLSCFI